MTASVLQCDPEEEEECLTWLMSFRIMWVIALGQGKALLIPTGFCGGRSIPNGRVWSLSGS